MSQSSKPKFTLQNYDPSNINILSSVPKKYQVHLDLEGIILKDL